LLVLLGVSVAAPAGTGAGLVGHRSTSVIAEQASTAPPIHDDPHHGLRLSAMALPAPATALPDSGWAVCPRSIGDFPPRGRSTRPEVGSAVPGGVASTARLSRAPPSASAGRSEV
jgi:hypothetical protein